MLTFSPVTFLTYESGPLSAGVVCEYFSYHRGPESQRLQSDRISFSASDIVSTDGGVFVKYSDGRWFFNAELDWVNRITRFQRSQDGASPTRTGYVEAWRWVVETGFMAGPGKVSFIYAWLPGPDRRHGVLIDRQPYFYGFANHGVFDPYSLAMNFYYGAGLGLFNLNTDGYMNDASIAALRLDYAVAANLNVFTSFFWADRASPHGYGWGFMRPAAAGSRVEFLNLSTINAFSPGAPSIPDNNLGWEIDAGMDWQLLEKWKIRFVAGYWQPGRWFNYACIDKTVPNWDIPATANNFGINPNRTIDPVVATKIFVYVEF